MAAVIDKRAEMQEPLETKLGDLPRVGWDKTRSEYYSVVIGIGVGQLQSFSKAQKLIRNRFSEKIINLILVS